MPAPQSVVSNRPKRYHARYLAPQTHGGIHLGLKLDKLHRGDCLELLKRVDDASIDLAFADPPFNIGYKYDVYKDKKSADEYLDWTRQWTAAV